MMRIAFGSDEKTALTDAVAEELEARGHELILIGPVGGDDEEWAEMGRHVGALVAEGACDTGVCFCWTGTGASIAAKKVAGVRAALCTDGTADAVLNFTGYYGSFIAESPQPSSAYDHPPGCEDRFVVQVNGTAGKSFNISGEWADALPNTEQACPFALAAVEAHGSYLGFKCSPAMGGLCVANGEANALGLGAACRPSAVPLGPQVFNLHDAVDQAVVPLLPAFPYLNTPLPGSR